MIRAALPDAQVNVEDLAGDGDHYAATRGERGFPRPAARADSTNWYSRRWAAAWAASCMPWRCKHPCPIRSQHDRANRGRRIQRDIAANPVMLYMKGTAQFPQCGFSARVVQILNHLGVTFATANVLEDPELRDGIKAFSNWPTIPQLYVAANSSAAATS